MIKIRKSHIDDVEKLQDLEADVFVDDPEYDSDRIPDWAHSEKCKEYFIDITNSPNDCCLVAEDDDKLIGYIAATPKKFDHRQSRYIEIENLGIKAEYQRQGIGTMLLEKCLEWAKENGFQKVYLCAFYANNHSRTFYKKNGFSEIHVSLEKDI